MAALSRIHEVTGRQLVSSIYSLDIYWQSIDHAIEIAPLKKALIVKAF
jgi:hypothetical protein